MWRNVYVRMLISIVAITVVVLFSQTVVLIIATRVAERSWKDRVFEDYVQTISNAFDENPNVTFQDLLYTLIESAPDRVSGLLIRDEEGDISISIGSNSRGDFIPQPDRGASLFESYNEASVAVPKSFSVSVNTTENYETSSVDVPKYALDITSTRRAGIIFVESVRVRESGLTGEMDVQIPDVLSHDDIVGSIILYNNGESYGYVDVLVFDIGVYGPTEILMRDVTGKFVIFLPVAVLISLFAGYFVSKRNYRMIVEIKRSLSQLALGNFKVKVDKSVVTYDDFDIIADSIEQLGDDLDRHRRSRKEWLKNISHDLNTPLTSLNLLLSGADDGVFPLNDELVKACKNETEILKQRIASVAYYSTLLDSKDIKINDMSILDAISSEITSREMFKIDASEDFFIRADYDLVKRALKEIFNNAETYGEKGSLINIEVKKEKESVKIYVRNKGKLPDPRPPFFEPWARGDESRHEGGSGLGLPIVHQIMELHHGSVIIDEEGGFVVVILSFPLNA